jgi:hypothetical protein
MYSTTGFDRHEIQDLCALIVRHDPRSMKGRGRRQVFGLFRKAVIVLTSLRRNRTQAEIAEAFQVHQTTISGIIAAYTPVVAQALEEHVPAVDDLDPAEQLIVDGTLLPCWSWKNTPENYSGKHRATGVNVQVACTLTGRLVWVSDPLPGSTHDAAAIRASGLLDTDPSPTHIGDKGYTGLGMLTPIKKQPGQENLHETDKQFNASLNQTRHHIERVIAHLTTWHILHTDYRRPITTFKTTITAVIALHFYKNQF